MLATENVINGDMKTRPIETINAYTYICMHAQPINYTMSIHIYNGHILSLPTTDLLGMCMYHETDSSCVPYVDKKVNLPS